MSVPRCLSLAGFISGERVSGVVALLKPRARSVAQRWWRHLACSLGGADEAAFVDEAERELNGLWASVLAGTASSWLADEGRRQRDRGVPFDELICSIHLFEEACVDELRALGLADRALLEAYVSLDRLSHARIVTLVRAYFQAETADASAREGALTAALAETRRLSRLHDLHGADPKMRDLYERISLCAKTRDTVLVCGETGTGKELVARAIHAEAGDPPSRFVAINCAAISRDLVESELFGHRRGSFSGAHTDRPGLARAASGGTLFLDEVTEISTETQAKLLRLIQERAVRMIGDVREVPVDLRIVASSNRPLEDALREGRLRRDLYYRLQRLVLHLPPLRDRRGDIPLLVNHFVQTRGERRSFTPAALERLTYHPWPGNVRELENVVHAACVFGEGATIRVEDLPPFDGAEEALPVGTQATSLKSAERETIARVLHDTEGNVAMASRVLGISRKQLYVKLRGYGITPR